MLDAPAVNHASIFPGLEESARHPASGTLRREPDSSLVGYLSPGVGEYLRSDMRVLVLLSMMCLATATHASEWRLGVGYATGLGDVTDLYEEDLRATGQEAKVDLKFPVGIAASYTYDWPEGWRVDAAVGPAFSIGGVIDHFELPLAVTGGYSFAPNRDFSPYVRLGVVHHFASGDRYEGSSPGLFAAVGIDFTHMTVEIATDQSELEFETVSCTGGSCATGRTKLNTYDVIASVYWRFRLF